MSRCNLHGLDFTDAVCPACTMALSQLCDYRVRCSAWVGAQLWSEEPPRAEGWWWWVQGEWDNEQPEIVRVWMKADLRTSDAPRKMHMKWNGGHKERVCSEVGGWWLGPVKQPKPPHAEIAPTTELDERS